METVFTESTIDATQTKKRTIDGNHCEAKHVVGYCHCRLHKGHLTKKLLDAHDCLHKNCVYLERNNEHPFFMQRNKNRDAKKQAKLMRKQMEQEQERVLKAIREHTADDGDFFAIRAEQTETGFTVYYIKYGWIDIGEYAYRLSKLLNARIFLKEIKNTLDNKYEILKAQGFM